MTDTKISAATDAGTLVGTDRVPLARSGSTTAYSTSLTALSGYVAISPYTSIPYMDGAGAAGGSALYSRGDHVHPSDTSKLSLSGGVMTGPLTLAADGVAALHAVTKQQLDALTTSAGYAPLASPVFTGNPQAPTAAVGDNDTSLATTQFVQSAIAPYSNDAGRNLLHNGRFEVQQRGAGPWTVSGYTLDRWQIGSAGTGTPISLGVAALSDANRADIGDEAGQYCASFTVTGTSGTNDYVLFTQKLEDVRRLAGKTVTVSFYANSGTANYKVGVSIDQSFGTGGSPSTAVNGSGQAVSLSSTVARFARYSLTFSVPSIAGKTLGSNGDHRTELYFWFSSGTGLAARAGSIGVQSGVINLWGVQLEVGSVATPLARRDPADELQLCQRFYQSHTSISMSGNAAGSGAGSALNFPLCLPVTMRATPTFGSASTGTNATSIGLGANSLTAISLSLTPSAAGQQYWNGSFTLSADL